jgi:hypothetical protein
MGDGEVLANINALMNEEHALLHAAEHGGLEDTQRARLHELQIQLDQCWDLLRQRRAKREFGQDPDDAKVRDAGTVERYKA